MIRLVIFDFDGVLVDSNDAWADAYAKSARGAGIETAVTQDELKRHFGKPYIEVLKGSFPDIAEDQAAMEKMYSNFDTLVSSEEFASSFGAIKGIKESLREMKKRFRLAVGSANTKRFLNKFLAKLGISEYFDLVVSGEDVVKGKPNPDMLLKALEHFKVAPHEAVYVGDSEADILAAKRANMHSIAVLSGTLTKEEALNLQPDYIVKDATEVQEVLACM